MNSRLANLRAALGFLHLPPRAPELKLLHRSPLLFAYGTLMRGYPLHAVLARGATAVGAGTVRGRLLDLGRYPGLVDGRGRVHGEIYRLDDAELLPVLDREEGYNFDRRRAVVTLAGGGRAWAWVYRYRGSRERGLSIPDGDYRRARPPSVWHR